MRPSSRKLKSFASNWIHLDRMALSPDLKSVSVPLTATLRDVLVAIDANALGITCVVDEDGKLQGIVTDGDVRRAILNGVSPSDSCTSVMNRSFVSGLVAASRNDNLRLMSERVRFLPIVDDAGDGVPTVVAPCLLQRQFEHL